MLCCIGLFGGTTLGQSLGGHWTVTAPAIGFGLGFLGDMTIMRGLHGKASSKRPAPFQLPGLTALTGRAADKTALPERPPDNRPDGG